MRGMWMTKSLTNLKWWGPPKSTHGMGLIREKSKTCTFLLKFRKKLMRRKAPLYFYLTFDETSLLK